MTPNKSSFYEQKDNLTGNLKMLLMPYFSFRLFIKFNDRKGQKRHLYGNEHNCTNHQLQQQKVPFILLDKQKGYTDLINLVEKRWQKKYSAAAIYMRPPGEKTFSILCRRYYDGELEECQDPIITPELNQTLYYHFENHRLQLSTFAAPPLPNFKEEINKALHQS